MQKGLPTMPKTPLLLAMSMLLSPAAMAQGSATPAKKLYCWNENGQRVCSDALPADAVNRARDEISVKSGRRRPKRKYSARSTRPPPIPGAAPTRPCWRRTRPRKR